MKLNSEKANPELNCMPSPLFALLTIKVWYQFRKGGTDRNDSAADGVNGGYKERENGNDFLAVNGDLFYYFIEISWL